MTLEAVTTSGDLMRLSMGPQHPSTHGVLRLIVDTDGEVVSRVQPDLGFLHRSIEKIGECVDWVQFVPYTDRVDYVCAMNSNHAYCTAVEALFGTDPACAVKVPLRGEYIRVLVAELNRISSHLVAVGAMSMDLGAYTPFLHGIAQRETVNDIFEKTCGARLTYNYVTVGGVTHDLYVGAEDDIARFCTELEREMLRFNRLITTNTIFRDRCAGVGTISAEEAIGWGLVGPSLRGSGVAFDVRKAEPYGVYDRLTFDVPVGDNFAGSRGAKGDSYDRFVVRVLEILESIRILRQCLKDMPKPGPQDKPADPDTGWQAEVKKVILRPPKGEIYHRVENPRGETGYHLVSDGTKIPYRIKIRTGSFTGVGIFEHLMRGIMIADIVTIIGSLDIVVPEIDR